MGPAAIYLSLASAIPSLGALHSSNPALQSRKPVTNALTVGFYLTDLSVPFELVYQLHCSYAQLLLMVSRLEHPTLENLLKLSLDLDYGAKLFVPNGTEHYRV